MTLKHHIQSMWICLWALILVIATGASVDASVQSTQPEEIMFVSFDNQGDSAILLYSPQMNRIIPLDSIPLPENHVVTDVDFSPTANHVLYSAFSPRSFGVSDLFLVNLTSNELQQITTTDDDFLSPQWSPNGSQIAYVFDRMSQKLSMLAYPSLISTDLVTRIGEIFGNTGMVQGYDWQSDSSLVFGLRLDARFEPSFASVFSIDTQTLQMQRLLPEGVSGTFPRWRNSTQELYFLCQNELEICTLDNVTNSVRQVTTLQSFVQNSFSQAENYTVRFDVNEGGGLAIRIAYFIGETSQSALIVSDPLFQSPQIITTWSQNVAQGSPVWIPHSNVWFPTPTPTFTPTRTNTPTRTFTPSPTPTPGPNLVTNGTFNTNTTGWSFVDAVASVSGGALDIRAQAGKPYGIFLQSVNTAGAANQTYELTVTARNTSESPEKSSVRWKCTGALTPVRRSRADDG